MQKNKDNNFSSNEHPDKLLTFKDYNGKLQIKIFKIEFKPRVH